MHSLFFDVFLQRNPTIDVLFQFQNIQPAGPPSSNSGPLGPCFPRSLTPALVEVDDPTEEDLRPITFQYLNKRGDMQIQSYRDQNGKAVERFSGYLIPD